MPGKPIGSPARLYIDWPRTDPAEGDILRTATTGRCYLITGTRQQTRGMHAFSRWHLACVVIDPADVPDDATIIEIQWYARGKKRTR